MRGRILLEKIEPPYHSLQLSVGPMRPHGLTRGSVSCLGESTRRYFTPYKVGLKTLWVIARWKWVNNEVVPTSTQQVLLAVL